MENFGELVFDATAHKTLWPPQGVDPDGNLHLHLNSKRGNYRFVFEVERGSFDPTVMFLKVNGVVVGPTARFWRVPGFEHFSPLTEHLPTRQMVCPIVEVYLDHAWQGSAITEFPSQAELRRGYHFGEFALELAQGKHVLKLVNGRGYRLKFLRLWMRPDERMPRRQVKLRPGLAGRHPRLFFSAADLPSLRARRRQPEFRSRWLCFAETIQKRLAEFKHGQSPDAWDILPLALMFLLTNRRQYFTLARAAFLRLLGEQLPGPEEGRLEVNGAEPGHLLEIAAVYYDWCYHVMDESERQLIRAVISRVLRWWLTYIRFNSLEWPGCAGGMEHSAYNFHGLGLTGLAFLGEIPEAQTAADWAARHFELAKRRVNSDGALGLLPKEHCLQAFLDYAAAFQHTTGINIVANWPFFKNFADGRIHKETAAMTIFPTYYRSDYEPDFIAWEKLAALTGSRSAQWLAERYFTKAQLKCGMAFSSVRVRDCSRAAAWMRFLFYNPRLSCKLDFKRRNPDRHLAGAGLVILRSGWWKSDTVHVMLNAARAHGKKLYLEEHRVAYAMPPHANSIGIYGFGQTLTSPIGNTYRQSSMLGNTLTIEGAGQKGEGSVFGVCQKWSETGRIVAYHPGEKIAYAVGEAAQCYEPEIGLQQFTRYLVFFKPDIVVVMDEVKLTQPRAAEIHFVFPIIEPTAFARKAKPNQLRVINRWQAEFQSATARLCLCLPPHLNLQLEQGTCPLARNYTDADSEYRRLTIRSAPARRHVFITVLLVGQTGETLPADWDKKLSKNSVGLESQWQASWRGRQLLFLPTLKNQKNIAIAGQHTLKFSCRLGTWHVQTLLAER